MTLSKKIIFCLLAAVCIIIYANSLKGEFISDDIPGIVKNTDFLAHPWADRSWKILFEPLTLISSFDYAIAKLNPIPYHLTSLFLHILNTMLAFIFLRIFFGIESAFLGACLFAAHPIHAEAVSWISGMPYLVLCSFILGCFLLYHNSIQKEGKPRTALYILSLGLFTYQLLHSFAFFSLFPFFLILCDLALERWKKTWRLWLPFIFLVAGRLLLARALISGRLSYVVREMGLNQAEWTNPIFNMAYSLYSHFRLLIWPAKLSLYHEPAIISSRLLIAILIILFLFLICAPLLFKKSKLVFLALAIFVVFLAPTYSPVPFSWLFAERYVYFPCISLCIVSAFLYEKYAQKCPNWKPCLSVIFILIIAAYAARTVARNEDWQDPGRLWRQTVAVSGLSPRAHNNMGDTYGREGNIAGAIREFKTAVELRPDYADAYHNLANTYESMGSSEEAIKYYTQAIKYNPELFESQYNLGLIYLNKGEKQEALMYLGKAKELRPGDPDVNIALNLAHKR